ncbi:DUF2637 domain-containing protein [Luteolibacter sp. GHJ8]|uniref:DUF2637 domain-containing protein n=1 Tax=Luteolibacter rhizosphaerae TaxID=2989719 RepID=A0ABT3FZJ4_9BACT|nr:DUF2637 domain-containing protein [Luteolibacter rhizosphaerae]MCW1913011.1 DUF2637 domain-containing protein [Luteolibacter rhizosphaerae]
MNSLDPVPEAIGAVEAREEQALKLIGRTTAVLVALLAVSAFVLSFEALRELAEREGGLVGPASLMFPVIVDGAICIFSLSALRAELAGDHRDVRWIKGLVLAVTLSSVGLNTLHAHGRPLAMVIAAVPPLLLYGSLEVLLLQARRRFVPAEAKARPRVPKSIPSQSDVEERREKALSLAKKGQSRREIAQTLGVSAATVSKYLRESA